MALTEKQKEYQPNNIANRKNIDPENVERIKAYNSGRNPNTRHDLKYISQMEIYKAAYRKKYRVEIAKKNRERNLRQKVKVINHYSNGTMGCECCAIDGLTFLTIDHINNDGAAHRREIGKSGRQIYDWIVNNNFPPGFRVLCWNCNSSRHINHGVCEHQISRHKVVSISESSKVD